MLIDEDGEQMHDVRKMVSAHNRKKKKSGGFQSMGNKIHLFLCSTYLWPCRPFSCCVMLF